MPTVVPATMRANNSSQFSSAPQPVLRRAANLARQLRCLARLRRSTRAPASKTIRHAETDSAARKCE
uniref:Uncharacterized protein n=1 Tax=Caenorhabditis japonica TaxID=281687 RepID=A0A8R1DHH5_CAEJA